MDNILNMAMAAGIIDLQSLRVQLDMHERSKYLEQHKNTIWQGKNGKWYTELPGNADHNRRLIKKVNKDDLEEEIINFYRTAEEHPTVRAVFTEWLDSKKEWNEITNATVERYTGDFKRYFDGSDFPGKRVDYITDAYLEDLIKQIIQKKQLTAKSYSNMRTLIRGIMKFAKRKQYTDFSASLFFGDLQISQKSLKKPEKKTQVFTQNEISILTDWLWNHPKLEHYGILLTFQTGLREGELAALKYSDIENNTIHVQRQETRYKADGECKSEIVNYTKSAAGDRNVVLTEEAQRIIKAIRKINPFGEYIFQKNGTRVKKQYFNDYLYRACDNCNIERRSMHKIRKTYGTLLVDAGTSQSIIKEQMGHSDITTTMKYYYKNNKDENETFEQVKKALSI